MKKGFKLKRAHFLKLPSAKSLAFVKSPFSKITRPPLLPQLLIIATCLLLYYLMVHYYLFFPWGFYLYYLLKLIIALAILSASWHSRLFPLLILTLGLTSLFTRCSFLTTLMTPETAWQLSALGVAGLLLAFLARRRLRSSS